MKTFDEVYEIVAALRRMDIWEDLFWTCGIDDNGDKDVVVSLRCNDLFLWGSADLEHVEVDDLPLLRQCHADLKVITTENGSYGGFDAYTSLLYACRKRGMRPQGAYYAELSKEIHHLFHACGPPRAVGFGNPKPGPVDASSPDV